jgi:Flp pilus assembly protein TadG
VKRRLARGTKGQSLVEFVLILPILMFIVFGVVDFGLGIRSYISLTNATREGARFAAVGNPAGSYPSNCDGSNNTTVIGRVCVAIDGLKLSDVQTVSVTYPNGQASGNSVVVAATYGYHFVSPLGALVHFFTGGTFPTTITLSTKSDMRLE